MGKNIITIFFSPILVGIDIYHNNHLPLMRKEMFSTYLLDLENECKDNLFALQSKLPFNNK